MLEDLGNLGDFLGGIAVIATMFYLALQIRRNTNTSQASSMHEFLENWRALTRLSIENPSILDVHRRGMADYDALSDEERELWFMYVIQFVFQAYIAQNYYEKGLLPIEDRDTWVEFVSRVLRTPGGQKLWVQVEHQFPQGASKLLSEHMAKTRDMPSYLDEVDLSSTPTPKQ